MNNKLEIGSVYLGQIQSSINSKVAARLLYIVKETEDNGYVALNITSQKHETLAKKQKYVTNINLKSSETGLRMDSFVKTNDAYIISNENIITKLENVAIPKQRQQQISTTFYNQIVQNPFEIRDTRKLLQLNITLKDTDTIIDKLTAFFSKSPDKLPSYFRFASRFPKLLAKDTALLFMQKPTAKQIASKRSWWDKHGLNVTKYENPLKIRYMTTTEVFMRGGMEIPVWQASEEEQRKIRSRELTTQSKRSFNMGSVYDISQTDCPESEYEQHIDKQYACFDHRQICDCIEEAARLEGIEIAYEDMNSRQLFCSSDPDCNKIHISDRLNDKQRATALCSEFARCTMHHHIYNTPVSVAKLEKNAFAMTLCTSFGVPPILGVSKDITDAFISVRDNGNYHLIGSCSKVAKANTYFRNQMKDVLAKNPHLLEIYRNRNRANGEIFVPKQPTPANANKPGIDKLRRRNP